VVAKSRVGREKTEALLFSGTLIEMSYMQKGRHVEWGASKRFFILEKTLEGSRVVQKTYRGCPHWIWRVCETGPASARGPKGEKKKNGRNYLSKRLARGGDRLDRHAALLQRWKKAAGGPAL